ncbi:MAG: sodium/solute symporter, partial [Phycisphaerales bacterium JB038]
CALPIYAACAAAYGETEILTYSGSTGRFLLDEQGRLTPPTTRPPFAARVLSYNVAEDAWGDAGRMPIGVVTTRAAVWDGRIVIPSGETRPGVRTPAVQALPLPSTLNGAQHGQFAALDYLVLGVYLALMVGIGVYFAQREKSTEEFFLAGRRIPWWAAGLSIFGTQLSAITFMAIPATAYGTDWRRFVGHLMLLPVFLIVIYAFLPFFRRLNLTTAYEYLEARFSLSLRLAASALFILFQFVRMGIVVLLPALALSAVTGMNAFLCIALMGVLATVYTALGGISAVIWTDVLQVFVLIGGALLCLIVAIANSGGVGPALDIATAADKLHIFDWRWSATDMVAWVLIIGFLFTNIVPYTTDQTVIQRYLTTPDEKQAARSLWLNLVITIPTGLLFYGLGTALFVFYVSHPAEQAALPESADQLVPWFVVTNLPAGVAGVVVAGIFAAAMSSLDSSMNSITTAVVNDFVERLGSSVIERDHLRLARTLTVALGVIGTGVAMLLATYEIKYLFDFFQRVIGLFGGGVTGVFFLAVFTRRANSIGAMVGLLSGAVITMGAAFLTEINALLYAGLGCATCFFLGYIASAALGGNRRDLAGLTLWTRDEVPVA